MNKSDNFNFFLQFRKDYPWFSYESFTYIINNHNLELTFTFNISNKHLFYPKIVIPIKDFFIQDNLSVLKLENIIFHIGLVELVSYWKTTCSPVIIIKPFKLSGEQINWWKKLYYNGLGEFFYLNNINIDFEDFVNFRIESEADLKHTEIELRDSVIVPIGGGKDSIVTLNLLSEIEKEIKCLIVNPRKATLETAGKAGYASENIIEVKRTIYPYLLELNEKGFLNGHTPFSALLAFVSLLCSAVTGIKNIALSNESSANESTVEDTIINHQYSKSYEFETDFRYYTHKYISSAFNYFSFLRPLNELQIGELFSKYEQYFSIFKSCNAGSKNDVWCCNCPKCLFTYIILSPFIEEKEMLKIFGRNLFESHEQINVFNKLTGREKIKPFDCIGTVDEINAALCMTISKKKNENLPFLLKYFAESESYLNCKGFYKDKFLLNFDSQNYLKPEYVNLLKNKLNIKE